jgi:hypothetical protein
MGEANELVALGEGLPGFDCLKASGGGVFEPKEGAVCEDITQQGDALFAQLCCWIVGVDGNLSSFCSDFSNGASLGVSRWNLGFQTHVRRLFC